MIVGLAGALLVVLAVAVAGKVTAPGFRRFRRSAGQLWPGRGRLGPGSRQALATIVLAGELVAAAGLAAGLAATVLTSYSARWLLLTGFAVAAALLAAFTVAHAVTVTRGRSVPCACFGRSTATVGPLTLTRTALLLGLSLIGLVAAWPGRGDAEPAAELLAALGGGVVGLLLVSLEDLVGLFRPSPVPTRPRG